MNIIKQYYCAICNYKYTEKQQALICCEDEKVDIIFECSSCDTKFECEDMAKECCDEDELDFLEIDGQTV